MKLSDPLSRLPHIQPQTLKRLENLKLFSIEDLLYHFPSRYEDLGIPQPIEKLLPGKISSLEGKVRSFSSKRSWKRKLLISEAIVEDETGYIRVIFFGQKFLEKTFQEGALVRLSGMIEEENGEYIMKSPSFERASRTPTHTGKIIGMYPETYGLTSKWFRWQIQMILPTLSSLSDFIPQEILDRYHLPSIQKALCDIHSPKTIDHALVAQKRFAFEDMFLLQLRSLRAQKDWKQTSSLSLPFPQSPQNLFSSLPFTLTKDQTSAIEAIWNDMQKPHPMNRLLNGDVGSGKTAVALLAMLHTGNNGHQSAILAPTEVLAFQHFETAKKILGNSGLSIALFTKSYRLLLHTCAGDTVQEVKRDGMLRAIKNNLIHIIIGTHAILQEDVLFSQLALVIVDEQHRFGVRQRASLQKKLKYYEDGLPEKTPHLLTMTATPIPRTLSLTLFGNLDISLLQSMPKGRKIIQTSVVKPKERQKIYTFILEEIQKGRQAYIILPLVSESEAFSGTKAATEEHKRLQEEVFPHLTLGLLHGKMKSKEKEEVMKKFKEGDTHILVATSVVEVGVDVPNATLMIIEEAQRFGLSQLHQFRGRIGRGEHQSFCFLFSGEDMDGPTRRMNILERHHDGFAIAEEDLKLRGPGEFFGSRQSGLPDIGMENLTNIKLITFAKKEAQEILEKDPSLKIHPSVQKQLDQFDSTTHLE